MNRVERPSKVRYTKKNGHRHKKSANGRLVDDEKESIH